jgi:hypothetical protein
LTFQTNFTDMPDIDNEHRSKFFKTSIIWIQYNVLNKTQFPNKLWNTYNKSNNKILFNKLNSMDGLCRIHCMNKRSMKRRDQFNELQLK